MRIVADEVADDSHPEETTMLQYPTVEWSQTSSIWLQIAWSPLINAVRWKLKNPSSKYKKMIQAW